MPESEDNLLESSVCCTLAFVKLLPSSYRLPPLLSKNIVTFGWIAGMAILQPAMHIKPAAYFLPSEMLRTFDSMHICKRKQNQISNRQVLSLFLGFLKSKSLIY